MSFGSLVLLAVSVAVDATTVAAAHGMVTPALAPRHFLGVGAFFGGFHVLMPLTGWLFGDTLGGTLHALHPWVAFAALATVGGKMAWDGLRAGARCRSRSGRRSQPAAEQGRRSSPRRTCSQQQDAAPRGWFTVRNLLLLSVVTSLDALAVGFALPVLAAPLVASLVTLGATTALLSSAGLLVGRHAGRLLEGRLELAGGAVIFGLAVKVLAQQL